MADRLRQFWDFDDLDSSEARLRAQLERETNDEGRAEVLTQLARVEGLRDHFDACEHLLREAGALAGWSNLARVRIDLERGRKLRSSGEPEASVSLFEAAFARALQSGEYFLAGDAAHMVAIADADSMLDWTQRGLDLAEAQPAAAYWAGPLWNNLGWHYYGAGDFAAALDAFERALEVRQRDPENTAAIEHARDAVTTARQALGG